MALGLGISLNNTLAVLSGFFGTPGEFVRTPKFGVIARSTSWKRDVRKARKTQKRVKIQPWLEFAIGLYLLTCLVMCFVDNPGQRLTIGVPFLCLFMVGYFYVPLTLWFGHRLGRASESEMEPLAAPVTAADMTGYTGWRGATDADRAAEPSKPLFPGPGEAASARSPRFQRADR
jgi:hypothetical protein